MPEKKISLKIILKGLSAGAGLNRALLFLLFACLLFLFYDIKTFFMPHMADMNSAGGSAAYFLKPAAVKKQQPISQPKPLEHYLRQVDKKLFKSALIEKESGFANNQQAAPAVNPQELVRKFVLKGIIEGQPPQAVIEDTKSGKTFFVMPGDKLEDFTIEEITGNKARLKYNGAVVEIVL